MIRMAIPNSAKEIGLIVLFLLCCIPAVVSGTTDSVADHSLMRSVFVIVPHDTFPPTLSPEQEARKQEVMQEQDRLNTLLKANRTFWEKKLDSRILRLLGSDSYKTTGKISEDDMILMQTYYSVIPSDQDAPTGDLFLVSIRITDTAPEQIADAYVARRTDTIVDPYHEIYCWVELNKLQSIASLNDVLQVRLVEKPRLSGEMNQIPTTKPSLAERNSETLEGVPTPVVTTIETPFTKDVAGSLSGKEKNSSLNATDTGIIPASPQSAPVSAGTISVSLLTVLLLMRREKNRR